jgi:hypothetical protein
MDKYHLRIIWFLTILLVFTATSKAQEATTDFAVAVYGGISLPSSDYLSTSLSNITKPKSVGQAYKYAINSNNHFKYLIVNVNLQLTIHQADISSYYWNNQWIDKANFTFDNDHADSYKNFFLNIGIGAKHTVHNTTFSFFPEAGLVFCSIGNQYHTFDSQRSTVQDKRRRDYQGWSSLAINLGAELTVKQRVTSCLSICFSAEWLTFNTKKMHFPNPYTDNRIAYSTFNMLVGMEYALK